MTVLELKAKFMTRLATRSIKSEDLGDATIKVFFPGKKVGTIPAFITFGTDGSVVLAQMKSVSLGNFSDNMRAGLRACNRATEKSTYARFSIDEKGDARASFSVYYSGFPDQHYLLMTYMVAGEIDDTYCFFKEANED